MITRRRFIQKVKEISYKTFFSFTLFPLFLKYAKAADDKSSFDMIALQGGKGPDELFKKGIEFLGGMKKFVKKGQKVLVKPNIGWDRSPEYGANTSPELIGVIVKECLNAGAAEVYVFDHTCDSWQNCYKNSKIEEYAKNNGGNVVAANSQEYYVKKSIPRAKVLKEALVHKLFVECDVVINVPVLKHHGSASVTGSMKNLMGVVWDRREWHSKDLHQCIADFATFRKTDLTVLDGWRVMVKNGPRGYSPSDAVKYEYLFISTDPVAIDSAGVSVLARENSSIKKPEDIRYIKLAREYGLGKTDLDKMNIKRITI
ncbi:MAG: DUF362 domain-containing protein [Spirochaetes bacterium]|nr:DUF362 domain-containing protein [Spirochaetota bacterium]